MDEAWRSLHFRVVRSQKHLPLQLDRLRLFSVDVLKGCVRVGLVSARPAVLCPCDGSRALCFRRSPTPSAPWPFLRGARAGGAATRSADCEMTPGRLWGEEEKRRKERARQTARGGQKREESCGRAFSVKLRAGLGKQPQSNTMFRLYCSCTAADENTVFQ